MLQVNHSESFNHVILVQHNNLTFELQVRIDTNVALDAGDVRAGSPLPLVKVNCTTSSATIMAIRAINGSTPVSVLTTTVPTQEPLSVPAAVGTAVLPASKSTSVASQATASGSASAFASTLQPQVAPQGMMVATRSASKSVAATAVGSEDAKAIQPTLAALMAGAAPATVPTAMVVSAPLASTTTHAPLGTIAPAAPASSAATFVPTGVYMTSSQTMQAMQAIQTVPMVPTAFTAPFAVPATSPWNYQPSRPANLQEVLAVINSLDHGEYAHLFGNPQVDIVATANKFFRHYERKGWKVGKAPMRDWTYALKQAIASGYSADMKLNGWAITFRSFSASGFKMD